MCHRTRIRDTSKFQHSVFAQWRRTFRRSDVITRDNVPYLSAEELDAIYARGLYDADIDQVWIDGSRDVAWLELKRTDELFMPFSWNDEEQQGRIAEMISNAHMEVERLVCNYSADTFTVLPSEYPFAPGKGLVFLLIYPENLASFSLLNLTNSESIKAISERIERCPDNKWNIITDELKPLLEVVGERIQPCISQSLFILLNCYCVRKYDKLDSYPLLNNNGYGEYLIKPNKDSDVELIEYYRGRFGLKGNGMINYNALSRVDNQTLVLYHRNMMHLLRKVLDINHIDTILDNHDVYQEFAELARADDLSYLKFADEHKPRGDEESPRFFD